MSTPHAPGPPTDPSSSTDGGTHIRFVEGGDPGPEVVAAISAVLGRPTVLVEPPADDTDQPGQTPWVRAARLEGIVHGRRITTKADLTWRGSGRGSA